MLNEKYIVDEFFDDMDINVCNMKCDIYEKGNYYYIELDVPGYSKEGLKVEYANGYITVIGTKNEEKNEDNRKYIRKERSYGVYKREFYVGEIDYTKAIAKYKEGTLYLTVPKKEEVNNTKNILIK